MKIAFEIQFGKVTPIHSRIIREHFDQLQDGWHEMNIEKSKARGPYRSTRYKYWFDCVLSLALPAVAERFMLVNANGEISHPSTSEELHEVLKLIYNPVQVIDATTGQVKVIGQTTTKLANRDFINRFEEEIIADLSGPPYFAFGDNGCPTREEWADMRVNNKWKKFKETFLSAA